MKVQYYLLALIMVLLPGCSPEIEKTSDIDRLLAMIEGQYDSREQMEADKLAGVAKEASHYWVNRVFMRVEAPEVGSHVMVGSTRYGGENWIFDDNEFFVWTFKTDSESGGILMSPRRFENPQRRKPYARDVERIGEIALNDLAPAISGASCDIVWTTSEQGFSGKSKPCAAMSTTRKKMMNWDWTYELTPNDLYISFSGTDSQGKVLDTTPVGAPYKLNRLTSLQDLETRNSVLRTATIYVKNWDASIRFYTKYMGYNLLVEQPIDKEKSLKTIGARGSDTARIAYLKPTNSLIKRPFAGNYLAIIEVKGDGRENLEFKRTVDPTIAMRGEVVLAHQVIGVDEMYEAMKADNDVIMVAPLSLSGGGQSRSFSVIDPNGVRIEIYEFIEGKEPVRNP